MKKIKTILVDDEPRGLGSLNKLLEMYCPEVEVVAKCTNTAEAKQKINELQPDLVFLDIEMPGGNGMGMLRDLVSYRFEVIFVTAHDNYLLEAFRFSAVDYLLKPIDEELLKEAVKRASKRTDEKEGNIPLETLMQNSQRMDILERRKLCIHSLRGFQVLELSHIIYCEAAGNYTIFHLTNDVSSICASKPLHEYETLLSDSGFLRIHKSYLINISHVQEYQRGEGGIVVLSNGFEAEVSRRRKDAFLHVMRETYKF